MYQTQRLCFLPFALLSWVCPYDLILVPPPLCCRCEVGTDMWVQCNDAPVKVCRYPVTGLCEGRSYTFRVRAVNSAGISRPSRVSDAVAALDPAELRRLQGQHGGWGTCPRRVGAQSLGKFPQDNARS